MTLTPGCAVVTGASRGLGRAIALELAGRGLDVIATMRDPRDATSVLGASKAALATLTESLDMELVPHGIRVIDVPLGPVKTDLWSTSIVARPPEAIHHEPYQALAERSYEQIRKAMPRAASTGEAATGIVDAILDPTRVGRVACDASAIAALAHWRSGDDQSRHREMLDHLGLER